MLDNMFAYSSPGTICFTAMPYSRLPSGNRHGKSFLRLLISWIN